MRFFIASSKESLSIAKEIAIMLDDTGHSPVLWSEPGVFIAGLYTFESLEYIKETVDGAIIVFSEDDKIWYREDSVKTVRDNVLIELGLFAGKLGRKKVAIFKVGNPKVSSDLLGINLINFDHKYRAEVEFNLWINSILTQEINTKEDICFGNFMDLFNRVCTNQYFENVKIFAISTNKTVRMLEGYKRLHIKKAEVLLREYDNKDPYYDPSMDHSIRTSIGLWEDMQNDGSIEELIVKRFNYHPDSGFYIFDKSYLILGHLHFTYPEIKVNFDKDAILIQDKSLLGADIIKWYTKKFDKIFLNF